MGEPYVWSRNLDIVMHIKITDNLQAMKLHQYPFNKKEQEFIAAEKKDLTRSK